MERMTLSAGGCSARGEFYVQTLCAVKPNRRTGSAGNREATAFLAGALGRFGYQVDADPFECLDYVCGGAALTSGVEAFEVYASPYSLGSDVEAGLVAASTLEELETADCRGRLLLMHGALCAEQLMPKNFAFYNPEHHQRLIALLESRQPAAIITATARNPEQVGALYPFPLFVDGDFDIPSVYCRETTGQVLAARRGELFRLAIDARRVPSTAANVIARLNAGAARKIVLTAHLDAYEATPGALDNASGTAVLLLCAERLSGYQGEDCLEITALNGEDHYSAGGQMDYLRRYGDELLRVLLAVNVDDVGYREGRSAYSFYGCPAALEEKVEGALRRCEGVVGGEPWYNGDHMIFVQRGVPALAFTSERGLELMQTVTHTALDAPALVDGRRLAEVAEAVCAVIAAGL